MMLVEKLERNEALGSLKSRYSKGQPFPHIVIDNFFEEKVARKILAEFPRREQGNWIYYNHINEKKLGKNSFEELPPNIKEAFSSLLSDSFTEWLSDLTGIPGLMPDPSLDGGGLHQTEAGGFLNIHADFNKHHKHADWRRRVNLLVYFNENWDESWGGILELWDRDMKRCEKKVVPQFNRALIFTTDDTSYHGYPNPMTCPEGVTRKSFALYYFTKELDESFAARSTTYKATPSDGPLRKLLIWSDMQALKVYSRVKRKFGLSDDFASKLLAKLWVNKRK